MGGHAYVIGGTVANHLLPSVTVEPWVEPPRPTFWQRLVRVGAAYAAPIPRVIVLRNGDRQYELAPGPLEEGLISDFKSWLQERISGPSEGTKALLEYLRDIKPSVYLRGLHRSSAPSPEFYVQISFSGCAGEAETSARVCAHWTGLWHRDQHECLRTKRLLPYGFTPNAPDPSAIEPMFFLPAGPLGYLEFTPVASRYPEQPTFHVDHSIAEAYAGSPLLARLDKAFASYMDGDRCRCAICEPGFGDAREVA